MNISIAIADPNKDYLYRLTEVLQQNRDLNISIFSSSQKLYKALEEDKFDVLLFDPDISAERIPLMDVKLAVCLYSDECQNIDRYKDCGKVLKYQRVSNIYKYILGEYADKAGYSLEPGNQTRAKVIGVYSPIGGAGKTTVALALAGKLKMIGNTVLFLSTEQFDSSSCINKREEAGIISLVEAINCEGINFKIKLEAICRKGLGEMDCLSGFFRLVDYEAVTGDEISRVLEATKKYSDYQYVVIDMDSNLDAINKAVFDTADQIILVEKPGETANYKMQLFVEQAAVQESRNKIFRIHNFAENNSSYIRENNIPVIGMIHNYGNLPMKSVIQAVNSNGCCDVDRLL